MTNALFECSRCIMNKSADIALRINDKGICHHCLRYDELVDSRVFRGQEAERLMGELVQKIKRSGEGKDYDCIIGVSGGVDSTYVAHLTKIHGLRPLAVHLDNGWNSELAVQNVEKVLKKLDIDLYTHVIDWSEFRDLQLSFLKASTPDGEIPSDHAIQALLWRMAAKHKVKYILSGMNFTTESISVPNWSYGHSDWRYVKGVHRKFGTESLSTYPRFGLFYLLYINFVLGIRMASVLNYIDYHKAEAMSLLEKEYGWVRYEGKHYESVYTRFYQGYILPKKFGIDKRYGHLSDLINAGQITREDALMEVAKPPYAEELQMQDLEYARKKLRLSESDFDAIMAEAPRTFREFPNSYDLVQLARNTVNWLRKYGLYPK